LELPAAEFAAADSTPAAASPPLLLAAPAFFVGAEVLGLDSMSENDTKSSSLTGQNRGYSTTQNQTTTHIYVNTLIRRSIPQQTIQSPTPQPL
jgi:hypothetical protein